jgi:hypothetical protein
VTAGTPSVPLYLSRSSGAVTPFVSVCLDGKGPYPFVLATGAARSLLAAPLAAELKLPAGIGGIAGAEGGMGCAQPTATVGVQHWSAGRLALAPQELAVADLPGFGTGPLPGGVLGGDVLSRFGAVRVDYGAKRLEVLAPESRPPQSASIRRADQLQPAPPLLVRSPSAAGALLTVLRSTQAALPTAATTFGGGSAQPFVIDTGAGRTTASAATATSASLPPTGDSLDTSVVGCAGTAAVHRSGQWSVGTVSQRPQAIAAGAVSAGGAGAPSGVVGSDTLSRYGSIVLDYRTAILWLGTG